MNITNQNSFDIINQPNHYNPLDFIVTKSNQNAYNTIINWSEKMLPRKWGILPFKNVLLITGPEKSGKTYLAHLWKEKSNAIFVDYKNSIQDYNNYNSLIIDDIDKIEEKKLLHLFNWANENNKFLLLTSNSKRISKKLLDLESRLKSVNTISIDLPDDYMMEVLILKHCHNLQLNLPQNIIYHLVQILPRNFQIVELAINIIYNTASINKINKKNINNILDQALDPAKDLGYRIK